jgi:hypothetical protein
MSILQMIVKLFKLIEIDFCLLSCFQLRTCKLGESQLKIIFSDIKWLESKINLRINDTYDNTIFSLIILDDDSDFPY